MVVVVVGVVLVDEGHVWVECESVATHQRVDGYTEVAFTLVGEGHGQMDVEPEVFLAVLLVVVEARADAMAVGMVVFPHGVRGMERAVPIIAVVLLRVRMREPIVG